jgi:hypothetical protein
MSVGLCAALAGIVALATGAVLTINLVGFRSTAATAAEILQERRRIVNPCLVMIGVAAAFWAVMMTVYTWWFILSNARIARILLHVH